MEMNAEKLRCENLKAAIPITGEVKGKEKRVP
jgi:hypothetical protein